MGGPLVSDDCQLHCLLVWQPLSPTPALAMHPISLRPALQRAGGGLRQPRGLQPHHAVRRRAGPRSLPRLRLVRRHRGEDARTAGAAHHGAGGGERARARRCLFSRVYSLPVLVPLGLMQVPPPKRVCCSVFAASSQGPSSCY